MKRYRTIIKVMLALAVLILLAGAVVYLFFLSSIAQGLVLRGLRNAGIVDSTLNVQQVSLNRIEIDGVSLGSPAWGSISHVSATYDLSIIWTQRLETMEVHDAAWRWTIRDGTIDFGMQQTKDQAPVALLRDAPFDQLQLHNLKLSIDEGDRVQEFAVTGKMVRRSTRSFDLDINAVGDPATLINAPGTTIAAPAATLRLRMTFTTDAVNLHVREDSEIGIDAIAAGAPESAIRAGPLRFTIPPESTQPLLRWTVSDELHSLRVAATARAMSPVQAGDDRMRLFAPTAMLSFDSTMTLGKPIQLRSDVSIQGGSLRYVVGENVISATGVDATIPIDFNTESPRRGPSKIGNVAWNDRIISSITSSVGFHNGSVFGEAAVPLAAVNLDLAGSVNFAEGTNGEVQFNLPLVSLADISALRGVLSDIETLDYGGFVAMNGTLKIVDGQVQPHIAVSMSNLIVEDTQADWNAAINSAQFEIVNLSPLQTAPDQSLVIDHARIGRLEVVHAETVFSVQSFDRISIDRVDLDMGENGYFVASPFTFNPYEPVIKTDIRCRNVGLSRWLPMLTDERADAQGELYGMFTVTIIPDSPQILYFGNGVLQSYAAGGTIQAHDAAILSAFLERHDTRFTADPRFQQVKDRIVAALNDFEFHNVRIEFWEDREGVPMTIDLSGIGRQGPAAQELTLQLNINDFNEVLRIAIAGRSLFR